MVDVARGFAPEHREPVALKLKTGVMVAAFLAAWIGLMTLAIVNIAADVNTGFKTAITLNPGIGPYSGKQLLMYTAWFVSWPVLHILLRNKDLNLKKWFGIFLVGTAVAVVLLWPPVFQGIAEAIKGG